jgi:uncharacterized protein YbjT (DUF2867 family)
MAAFATALASNGIIDIGGPDKISFAEMARIVLAGTGEDKTVVVDPEATYFGTPVDDNSLVTGDGGRLAATRFG